MGWMTSDEEDETYEWLRSRQRCKAKVHMHMGFGFERSITFVERSSSYVFF